MTIRVLHVITSLPRGGAERQLVNIVCNTNRAEFEHVVCYLHPPDDFAPEIERAGHKVINLNVRGKHPWLAGTRKLAAVMRAERPDLVQTWLYDATVVARLAQWVTSRAPLLLNTLHSTDYNPETIRTYGLAPRKINVLRLIDKWTARLARAIYLPVSQTVADSNAHHLGLPPEKVRVMYNSIDQCSLACADDAPLRLRQELNVPDEAFVFLNVGRMDLSKGQTHLLRAFASVTAAEPHAYLVIVGDGPRMPELRRLADELDLMARVRFAGRRDDVGACLEMADVFVFPSLVEGLPLAPIEAMLKGLPCILSRIEPVLEVFSDLETGVLVAPRSVDELAAAMIKLYREPELRRRLGERAHTEASQRFDSRTGLRAWENLYRELAPRPA